MTDPLVLKQHKEVWPFQEPFKVKKRKKKEKERESEKEKKEE